VNTDSTPLAPQAQTVQIDDPTCKKRLANGAVITARLRNNSSFVLLRLDFVIVMARYGQLTPVAQTEQTVFFPAGIDQNESTEIQIPIETDSLNALIEQPDLEILLRPAVVHVADRKGYVQVSEMRGVATVVVRDWIAKSGYQKTIPHMAAQRE
jgi:hypothetical protein